MSLNYLEKWNKEENMPEDIFNKSTSDFESCGILNMVLGLVALLKYMIFFTRSKVGWYLTLVYPGLSHFQYWKSYPRKPPNPRKIEKIDHPEKGIISTWMIMILDSFRLC